MECGIKGALPDLQDLFGHLLDALGDCPAMLRLEGDDAQDEQVESALYQIVRFSQADLLG